MAIVEGVGDEVILSSAALVLFIAVTFYSWYRLEKSDEEKVPESDNAPPVHNPHTCPICWGEQRFPVETNCGHLFCGECLYSLYDLNTNAIRFGLNCPMCRQEVTILFLCLSTDEKQLSANTQQIKQIKKFVNSYNRKFSTGYRSILDQLRDVPILFRHFIREVLEGDNIEETYIYFRCCILLLVTITYVFIPSDILPEYVFGVLGFLDDITLIAFVVTFIAMKYYNLIVNRVVE